MHVFLHMRKKNPKNQRIHTTKNKLTIIFKCNPVAKNVKANNHKKKKNQ